MEFIHHFPSTGSGSAISRKVRLYHTSYLLVKTNTRTPKVPHFLLLPLVCMLSLMSCGMEYPFGQWGSAVPAASLPSFLCTSSLLAVLLCVESVNGSTRSFGCRTEFLAAQEGSSTYFVTTPVLNHRVTSMNSAFQCYPFFRLLCNICPGNTATTGQSNITSTSLTQ